MVFPGYLIGIMSCGFLIVFIFALFLVIGAYLITNLSSNCIMFLVRLLLSFVGVRIAFSCIQRLLVRYVLTNRELSKQAVNVKHPHAYSVLSFYLLFANIVFGFAGAIKRTVLVCLTSALFVGRIDRNPLIFFTSFDASSRYYGYLRFQNCFKNPLMRCFCQILIEPTAAHVNQLTTQEATRSVWGKSNETSWNVDFTQLTPPNRKKKVARNRWHLAYTLSRNPSLIQYRYVDHRNNVNATHIGSSKVV